MGNQLKIRLYGFRSNDGFISTQYGLLRYSDWLNKEKGRIEKNPARKVQIVVSGEFSALNVNEVKGCNCFHCLKLEPKEQKEP